MHVLLCILKESKEDLRVSNFDCCVAIVTPFLESGALDFKSLDNLMLSLINNGIKKIVVGGTTGEGILLSESEKKALIEHISHNFPSLYLIGCYSSVCIGDMSAYEKCDQLLVSPQYFIKPDIDSKFDYISNICKISGKDVILYNNPSRFSTVIEPELYDRLYELENIKGVKEAGEILDIARYPKWKWFGGNDDLLNVFKANNFDGMISAVGNVFPKLFMNHDSRWLEISDLLFSVPSPLSIKYVLYKLGVISSYKMRLHLIKTDKLDEMFIKVQKYVVN